MRFADLTWARDVQDENGNYMGWRAEYEAPNGFLLCVDCVLDSTLEDPTLASATEPDQKYNATIFSWDRAAGSTDYHSQELGCTNNRVDTIIGEMEALQGEVFPETTTTTAAPSGPSGQWD